MEKRIIEVTIEIPLHSNIKYEWDRGQKKIVVDRILRDNFKYPANYGFLEDALDWDGDELDVLVFSPETFMPGVTLKARLIGAMKMIDDGEIDTKLIAVHENDYRLDHIQDLKDLPQTFLDQIKIFFSTYKNWKRSNITSVEGFENQTWAWKEYAECQKLMKKYGKLSKKAFLIKMRQLYPKKYIKTK